MSNKPPYSLSRFLRKARAVIESKDSLGKLISDAREKLRNSTSERVDEFKEKAFLLLDLLQCYRRGEYRDVSPRSLITIVAGVLYFLLPLDSLPDFLFGIGFIDDAAIIGYVVSAVSGELEAFSRWLNEKSALGDDEPVD